MEGPWTILELAERAAETLAAAPSANDDGTPAGPGRANGRVRDVPNERLIRWYGTVGLVDPPLSRRGRVARYGRRHLLQLVAVKRRQAEGKSLAEIQAELAGATDETLAAVARVPAAAPGGAHAPAPALAPEADDGPGRFWTRQPRELLEEASTADPGQDDRGVPAAGLVHGIRLAPGVTLLLDGAGREPGPRDLTGIANAARPLLTELASRGLAPSAIHQPAEMDHDPQTGAGNEH